MSGEDLKRRRVIGGIPGKLLCDRAKIDRGRLSHIERGYVRPSDGELARLNSALSELLEAKQKVTATAVECGWPVSSI